MQPSFIFPPDNDHPYFHSSDNLQYGCTIQSGTNVSYVGNDIQSISTQSIIFDSLFDFWLCGVVMCHYWFRFNAFNPSSCHISSDMTIHDDPAQVWNGPYCGEEKKKKRSSIRWWCAILGTFIFESRWPSLLNGSLFSRPGLLIMVTVNVSYSLWRWWITSILLPFIWVHCLWQSS